MSYCRLIGRDGAYILGRDLAYVVTRDNSCSYAYTCRNRTLRVQVEAREMTVSADLCRTN